MELSGEGKDVRIPRSSGYNPLASSGSAAAAAAAAAAGGGGGGGDGHNGVDNGTTVFHPPQALDHHFLGRQQQELNREQQLLDEGSDPDPDPDPLHVAGIGVGAGATISPTSGGSSAKGLVRYRECLKNHAASVGGNIVDGCGEFMPNGEDGTLEALMCAACNCHRNFHRKEVDGETNGRSAAHFHQLPPALPSPSYNLHHQKFPKGIHTAPSTFIIPPMSMAFGGSVGPTESSSEDLRAFEANAGPTPPPPPLSLSKKRFRTKFTQEQKGKMLELAEKVGWRMQKQDEEQVQKLCAEVGIKRQVFKVWMHNNKNTVKKQHQQQQQQQQQPPPL